MIRFIRDTILPSKATQLLLQTGQKWNQDNCSGMAAALSYHALFSLFPILLVILSIIGSLIEPNTEAFQNMTAVIERYLPPEVHDLVKGTIISLNQSSAGAGIVGFGLLLFTASTVFSVLSSSVNRIWRSPNPAHTSIRKTVLSFVVEKIWAFLLVLGTGLLLLSSLISNIVIKTILGLVANFRQTFSFIQVDELQLAKGLQGGSSFLILAVTACILFKILPSVYVRWVDVWLGAVITALLLAGLQQLVSNSVITIGSHFLSYGVIGSVMILLTWIYLACCIFLFGCEFSYVYAHLFGSRSAVKQLNTQNY
ncbi:MULTISPECIES: YihY/virulence factor BrkB family protein [unclassified Nodularia (in: cyanobacteria)]|uniref:YihY/virulence factor BrkB family protein n=1 Tax=unclassified Nodularia (in: cyanobacteria) TaxID=2656917 RepID=UPI00187FE305|nr:MULTISPECIES: YihY/virulence factor BrkB family protein [unclassified Nodularia (in: cyanobacteria)]MBE9200498.1 YihY/virulence factor BrkB family protein [Nodularia sp. LEGE 06071]MCC2691206.1 YihY/virulence factor BrkB family protein [Nodularia sp. LEGE 04288]